MSGHRRLGQHNPDALRALQQFDDDRRSLDLFDAIGDVFGLPCVHCRRQTDVVSAQELQTTQLVARTGDGLRFVKAIDAHHLELADDGEAEVGDRSADARHDGIDRADRLSLIEQFGIATTDADVELQGVEYARIMSALAGRFDQRPRAEQLFAARQDDKTHGINLTGSFSDASAKRPAPTLLRSVAKLLRWLHSSAHTCY